MSLITAEQFRKAQAQAYNRRGIVRIMQLRQEWRATFPPIDPAMATRGSYLYKEFQQVDRLITFLLDINGEDGTIESDAPNKPEPPEAA